MNHKKTSKSLTLLALIIFSVSSYHIFTDEPSTDCNKTIDNCLVCDSSKKDCYKCEPLYFVTLENQCEQCPEGCTVCYKKEYCVACTKFRKVKKDFPKTCELDPKELLPYIVFWILLGLIVIMSLCWCRLKCKNRRKLRTLKEKAEEIKASPLLTPMNASLLGDPENEGENVIDDM
jgi:hypothetical protein